MIEKIKSLDKKVLILIGTMIAVPVLLIIILAVARGCSSKMSYEKYEDKMIKAAEKYFKAKKELPTSEGEKKEITLKKLVKNGYIKSSEDLLEDSTCKGTVTVQLNGELVKQNDGGYYLYSVNLDCKEYSTNSLSDELISKVVTTGAGLYQTENGYIYKGETDASKGEYVNNYVEFFGKQYRIMSIDLDGDIKLIKSEKENISSVWDSKYNEQVKKAYGENKYADSSIIKRLVDDYNNIKKFKNESKKYIVAKSICVDPISINSNSLSAATCNNVLSNQLIGVVSVYDYANASLDPDCNNIYSRSCRNYNYMRDFLDDSWTYSTVSEDTYNVYYLSQGLPEYKKASSMMKYYIVINISGGITDFSGDGSLENPYIIK